VRFESHELSPALLKRLRDVTKLPVEPQLQRANLKLLRAFNSTTSLLRVPRCREPRNNACRLPTNIRSNQILTEKFVTCFNVHSFIHLPDIRGALPH